jgi:hypothetical protein
LRHKAALLLDKRIGLEVLISEQYISNHKAKVVMFLDGVIQRDSQGRGYGVLVTRSGIGASISLLLEFELRGPVTMGLHSVSHPLAHVSVRVAQPGSLPLSLRGCVPQGGHSSDYWMGLLKHRRIDEAQSAVDVEVMKTSTNHHTSLLGRDSIPRV